MEKGVSRAIQKRMDYKEKKSPEICDTCKQPIKSDGIVMIIGESVCWECLERKKDSNMVECRYVRDGKTEG